MSESARRPVHRTRWVWALVVFLLVVGAITAAIALAVKGGTDDPAGTGASTAPASGSADGTSTPGAASSAAADPVIPATCAKIYTKDWTPEMDGLVLNPDWTADPQSGVRYGSKDEGLVAVLEATTKVTCVWAHPKGGNDTGGLTTNVARLTEAQEADVREHLDQLGYTCYDELGGTRCVTEASSENGTVGESHFLRDGVWLATWWLNVAPDGYTHDIVAALWPAGA